MSKFFVPKRFDPATAKGGEWFSIHDEMDVHYGDFKLKYLDRRSTMYENAIKRVKLKFAKEIRTKKLTDYDNARVILCELHLLDWKLPTDPNDTKAKPVPFSLDNAMEYFGMTEEVEGETFFPTGWILDELGKLATEPSNFQGAGAEQPTAEDVAGN